MRWNSRITCIPFSQLRQHLNFSTAASVVWHALHRFSGKRRSHHAEAQNKYNKQATRPSSDTWYGGCSCGHLLAIGEGVWTTLFLEGFMETRLHLHPLADIVDDPDGQPLGCHKLHCPQPCQHFLQSILPLSTRRLHKFGLEMGGGGEGGRKGERREGGGGKQQNCGHAV